MIAPPGHSVAVMIYKLPHTTYCRIFIGSIETVVLAVTEEVIERAFSAAVASRVSARTLVLLCNTHTHRPYVTLCTHNLGKGHLCVCRYR